MEIIVFSMNGKTAIKLEILWTQMCCAMTAPSKPQLKWANFLLSVYIYFPLLSNLLLKSYWFYVYFPFDDKMCVKSF